MMRQFGLLSAFGLTFLFACGDKEDGDGDGSGGEAVDADSDGFSADDDCDDDNAEINPDAAEVCDTIDNDCDGLTDDDDDNVDLSAGGTWYADQDGDGYGPSDQEVSGCRQPAGSTVKDGDCDDDNAAVNPDATEVCDAIDNDCDELTDDADDSLDLFTASDWYADADSDGYGDPAVETTACDAPAGNVDNADDCDDADAAVNPGATEVCDEADTDEDCSGLADDDDSGVDTSTQLSYYPDEDEDSYGDLSGEATLYCDPPAGRVTDNTDCDDTDERNYPGAAELCDGVDTDCDGTIPADESDDDTDGYVECSIHFSGWDGGGTVSGGDCDDADAAIHPGAAEVCDDADTDEDCSGLADDDDSGVDTSTQTTWYLDVDVDGYGDVEDPGSLYCDAPGGLVTDNTDCDDGDAELNPGAAEICDGFDNDCDSSTTDAGIVTFTDTAGAQTDYSSLLSAGTSSSPASLALSSAGDLAICEGTWYVTLDIAASIDIWNPSGSASDVVLDGAASGSVISVETSSVALSLEDITIQNGDGSGDVFGGGAADSGGGIYCNAAGATITGTSLNLLDNTASNTGGAIASTGCDIDLEDVVIAGSSAPYGGGIYAMDGTISIADSALYDNYADANGGALNIYDYDGAIDLELDEVEIHDNLADVGGGMVLWEDGNGATASCTGSASTGAGFTDNVAVSEGGGIYLYGDADFTSSSCDFGTSSGGDDNDPEDIYLESTGSIFDADDDESFVCTDGSCEAPTTVSYTIGGTTDNYTGDPYLRGNLVLADENVTLSSYALYLDADPGCTLDFYVLSASSTSGPWTIEWSDKGVATGSGLGFYESGAVGVEISAGTYYSILTGWVCSGSDTVTYYRSSSTSGSNIDPGFGTHVGSYSYSNSYSSTWSTSPTLSLAGLSVWYYMRLDLSL